MEPRRCSVLTCVSPVRARGLCNKHYLRAWNDGTLDLVVPLPKATARFWSKVDRRGSDDCWLWTASVCREGYGRFNATDIDLPSTLAHRIAYEWTVGPIPEGLHLDHLCRVRNCVNPAHLEPVTAAENTRRAANFNRSKMMCDSGHPFSPDNTVVYDGKRACRACRNRWSLSYKQRQRA